MNYKTAFVGWSHAL